MRIDSPGAATGGPRIVLLIGHFGRGGSERQAFLLARELARYGKNVETWSLTETGEYADDFESVGVRTRACQFKMPRCPVRAVWLFSWVGRLWRFSRQLKRARVDALIPFTTWPNVVAGLSYRLGGVRLCVWGERSVGLERLKGFDWLAAKQYRHFVANSSAGVEFLARNMGITRERIRYIPNGVEEPEVRDSIDWRGRLGLRPGQLLVVKVANITNYKDHATLLRAWKIVQDAWTRDPKPVLAFAGQFGNAYEKCLGIADELGLYATVRFLGGISDVPSLLRACDLTVFSSPNEGMPNAVLECMAAGKAVIASDLPGVRDALGGKHNDVLVRPGDANGFATRLLALLRDTNRCDELGRANLDRIRTEFSVDRMVDTFLGLIEGQTPQASLSERSALASAPSARTALASSFARKPKE